MASSVVHNWGYHRGNFTLMPVLDMFTEQVQTLSSRKCCIPCSIPHAANAVPHANPRAACLWVSCPGCSHVWNCQQGSRTCRRCLSQVASVPKTVNQTWQSYMLDSCVFFCISCLDFCSVNPIRVNDKEVFNYMTAVSASRSRGSVTGLELVGQKVRVSVTGSVDDIF